MGRPGCWPAAASPALVQHCARRRDAALRRAEQGSLPAGPCRRACVRARPSTLSWPQQGSWIGARAYTRCKKYMGPERVGARSGMMGVQVSEGGRRSGQERCALRQRRGHQSILARRSFFLSLWNFLDCGQQRGGPAQRCGAGEGATRTCRRAAAGTHAERLPPRPTCQERWRQHRLRQQHRWRHRRRQAPGGALLPCLRPRRRPAPAGAARCRAPAAS